MRFNSGKPIFQQIKDHLEDQVIRGELLPDERVPAVRDYALALEVNPNTVVRSFLELEESGVIYKKRGLGYFLSPDAKEKILAVRKHQFLAVEWPDVMQRIKQLDIDITTLVKLYQNYAAKEDAPWRPTLQKDIS